MDHDCTRALQCWRERGGSTARRVAPRPTTMASLHSCKPTLKGGRGRHHRRVFVLRRPRCDRRCVGEAWAHMSRLHISAAPPLSKRAHEADAALGLRRHERRTEISHFVRLILSRLDRYGGRMPRIFLCFASATMFTSSQAYAQSPPQQINAWCGCLAAWRPRRREPGSSATCRARGGMPSCAC